MKKLLINVISSEKTWTNFSKFGFDKEIIKHRKEFDLSIVLNGYENDAIKYYNSFKPEYFFLRPNLGFDTAAVAYVIELLPEYEHYLIIHDDHWFTNNSWFERINELLEKNPHVDIWGNILMQEPMARFNEYCKMVNLPDFANSNQYEFLHGMSGVFNFKSIKALKEFKVPYLMSMEKDIAFLGERLFSNIISFLNLSMAQFPEGVFNFFLHGEGNYKNYLFSAANVAFHKSEFIKAKEFFYKYYEYCTKNNYLDDMGTLFNNLAGTHYRLNEKKEAKYIWKNLLERVPDFRIPKEGRELLDDPNY